MLLALLAFAFVSCARNQANVRGAAYLAASLPQPGSSAVDTSPGHLLFLKNCAHCHGADAHGDEGPDLHNLDWTDEQVAMRIRNGKKGQMTAFAGKFSADDIRRVIAYLRTLN